VIRKTPADQGNNQLLGLQIAFGHRVDGPFEGYPVGFIEVQPQEGASGQGRLPSGPDYLLQHIVIQFHKSAPFFAARRPSLAAWEKAGPRPPYCSVSGKP
jgi:hypothetical protein